MRILTCTNTYPPRFVGGAELMAHELALELAKAGHEVEAFVGDLDGPLARYATATDSLDGLAVHRIGLIGEDYDPGRQNLVHSRVDAYFQTILEKFKPDVVHIHNLMGLSIRLPILAAEHGARVAITLHDFWGICLRNTLLQKDNMECKDISLCRECLPFEQGPRSGIVPMRVRKDMIALAFDHVDAFISPSRFLADRYREFGIPAAKLHHVPNGVDTVRFGATIASSADEKAPIRLLYVGYLGAHKGVRLLPKALKLMQKLQCVELILVGDGPLMAECKTEVMELGLASQVRFLGRIPTERLPTVYREADVVVLPSIWNENQPVCLMEAMASNLPTVASRIGGIPEIVKHEETGLLFNAGDVHELATALDRLVASPELRRRLGDNGRQRATCGTYRRQTETTLNVFERLINTPAKMTNRFPIIPVIGKYNILNSKDDISILEEGHLISSYLIPISWLTFHQKSSSSKIYFTKIQKFWPSVILRFWNFMIPILLTRLSPKSKVILINCFVRALPGPAEES